MELARSLTTALGDMDEIALASSVDSLLSSTVDEQKNVAKILLTNEETNNSFKYIDKILNRSTSKKVYTCKYINTLFHFCLMS